MVEIKLQITDNVAKSDACYASRYHRRRLKCNASIESNSVMPRLPSQATSKDAFQNIARRGR